MNTASHTEILERERPHLLAVAYRMLGSRGEAEDLVQEALTRLPVDEPVHSPRAFLTTVVTRLCLDELKSARRRRETYAGPWLPEPFLETSPEDHEAQRAEVSLALLLLLEQLNPRERVVFVLREMMDCSFEEIAVALDTTEPACRKILQRAREKVQAERSSAYKPADPDVTMRFLAAAAMGDVSQLIALLAPDASLITDHGGKASGARVILHGAASVAKLIVGGRKWEPTAGLRYETRPGHAGTLVLGFAPDGACVVAIHVETHGDQVARVLVYRNPDKLSRLA
jgi:RNA polymerase sigma factor (sigma-70 family)